jgi:hypothetical protein
MTLDKNSALVRINSTGNVKRSNFTRLLSQHFRILVYRDRVQVNNTEEVILLVLLRCPAADCTQIIADMQVP